MVGNPLGVPLHNMGLLMLLLETEKHSLFPSGEMPSPVPHACHKASSVTSAPLVDNKRDGGYQKPLSLIVGSGAAKTKERQIPQSKPEPLCLCVLPMQVKDGWISRW